MASKYPHSVQQQQWEQGDGRVRVGFSSQNKHTRMLSGVSADGTTAGDSVSGGLVGMLRSQFATAERVIDRLLAWGGSSGHTYAQAATGGVGGARGDDGGRSAARGSTAGLGSGGDCGVGGKAGMAASRWSALLAAGIGIGPGDVSGGVSTAAALMDWVQALALVRECEQCLNI
jgi:hypothetical protein